MRRLGATALVLLAIIGLGAGGGAVAYAFGVIPSPGQHYVPASHVVAGQSVNAVFPHPVTKSYISLSAGEYMLWMHGSFATSGPVPVGDWALHECKIETAEGQIFDDFSIPMHVGPDATTTDSDGNTHIEGSAIAELPSAPIAVSLTRDENNMYIQCDGILEGAPIVAFVRGLRLDALQVSSLVGVGFVGNQPPPADTTTTTTVIP